MRMMMNAGMPDLDVTLGGGSITLRGAQMSVEIDVDFKPATPDNADGPGDVAQVRINWVRLHRSLALHDMTDIATLVLSSGTDVLQFMPARDIERLAEKILHEVLGLR